MTNGFYEIILWTNSALSADQIRLLHEYARQTWQPESIDLACAIGALICAWTVIWLLYRIIITQVDSHDEPIYR